MFRLRRSSRNGGGRSRTRYTSKSGVGGVLGSRSTGMRSPCQKCVSCRTRGRRGGEAVSTARYHWRPFPSTPVGVAFSSLGGHCRFTPPTFVVPRHPRVGVCFRPVVSPAPWSLVMAWKRTTPSSIQRTTDGVRTIFCGLVTTRRPHVSSWAVGCP